MGKAEVFKNESVKFIKKVKINPYEENIWFSSAYPTLNPLKTINDCSLSVEEKKNLRILLFSSIENLKSVPTYDYDNGSTNLPKKLLHNFLNFPLAILKS